MSYIRFENTLSALEDCLDHITDKVPAEEHEARVRLIEVAKDIVREARENRWIAEEQDDSEDSEAEAEVSEEDEG
jgi:hypothetical protein